MSVNEPSEKHKKEIKKSSSSVFFYWIYLHHWFYSFLSYSLRDMWIVENKFCLKILKNSLYVHYRKIIFSENYWKLKKMEIFLFS